ncbi:aminotransferase class I/II-fold pyridoxal phosphate-dependent enzyme [Candidatus Vidania fulgoroideorum]
MIINLDKMEFPYNFNLYFSKYLLKYKHKLYLNKYPIKNYYFDIIEKLKKFYNTKKNIILGNGSDEIISFIISSLRYKKFKTIGSFYPSFSMYENYSRYLNIPFLRIKIFKNKYFNVKKLIKLINYYKCNVFFICFPNNPTGFLFKKNKIKKLIKKNKKTIFIIDEAYFNYSDLTFINSKIKNLIIIRSLSKIGFASLRIGILFCNKKIYRLLQNKIPLYPLNIYQIIFIKFFIKIKIKKKILFLTKNIKKSRSCILKNIKNIIYNSYGNFFFIKIKNYFVFKKIYLKNFVFKQLFLNKNKFLRFSLWNKKHNKNLLKIFKNDE